MALIHLMHPDRFFGAFLSQYLNLQGFETLCTDSNIECFYSINKNKPNLIVLNKESPYLDIEGFLIKKRNTEKIEDIPIFVIGDFSPKEIAHFKTLHVEAFLSKRINPVALTERLRLYFKIPLPAPEKRTPMLVDIHAKESTLIIQIEANLESDKLLILNFRIRLFLQEKKSRTPRIMFIIPSLYPDMVNKTTVSQLFGFLDFGELKIDPLKIVVLTSNKHFLDTMASLSKLSTIRVVKDYYEGYRSITADFDLETKVALDYIKVGSRYFLDLFDTKNTVRLAAQQTMTEDLLKALKQEGVRYLKYYGKKAASTVNDTDIIASVEESESQTGTDESGPKDDETLLELLVTSDSDHGFSLLDTTTMDYITSDFVPVSAELFDEQVLNEKQNLFFSKDRGQPLLFVSLNTGLFELVQQALSVYFDIENIQAGANIKPMLDAKRYGIIFIDLSIPQEIVVKILHVIRSHATRRKTTIILMAKTVGKAELMTYKKYGTDHVILHPFTTEKFYNKVYTAVTLDRGM